MGGSEGAGKRVNTACFHKLFCLLRIRINLSVVSVGVPRAGFPFSHAAKLRLHASPGFCGHLHRPFCIFQILRIGQHRAVIHNPCKADFQRLFQIVQRFAVIQMNADRHGRFLCLRYHNRPNQRKRHPWLMTLRKLHNDRQI